MLVYMRKQMPDELSRLGLTVSVRDAAEALGWSEASLRMAIHRKRVKVRRVGARVLVPRSEIERIAMIRGAG